jgi:hypothetical protein
MLDEWLPLRQYRRGFPVFMRHMFWVHMCKILTLFKNAVFRATMRLSCMLPDSINFSTFYYYYRLEYLSYDGER